MSEAIDLLFSGLSGSADAFALGTTTVALVRAGSDLIVFDTGPYAYRPILQARLRQANVAQEDVTAVVLSHLHWDTAANADLFPNAEIVIDARELAAAEGDQSDDERPAYLGRVMRRLRLRVLEQPLVFAPGIETVSLPGHTPGSIGLRVGSSLLAGDAVATVRDAIAGRVLGPSSDPGAADRCLVQAVAAADVIYPGHDRPFRTRPRVAYASDYELRMRFFLQPDGDDEEIGITAGAPRSFATWP